jgi:pimeloyl-ACP methyl ester carboxylesterase
MGSIVLRIEGDDWTERRNCRRRAPAGTLGLPPKARPNPTIVFLHEGLGSVSLWKDFPRQVAEQTGCGALVYSRYGHGDSDRLEEKRPVEFMHREAKIVLPSLLQKLAIEKPILLGHSDGGSIALIYASVHPGSVRALILEAPHVFVEDLTVRSIAEIGRQYRVTDLPAKLGRHHRHVDATFWGWNDIWLDPQFRSWNIEACLESITCPLLLIQGYDDEYGTMRQIETIRSKLAWAETLLLPKCGHSPHRDQPEAVLERITRFVATLAYQGVPAEPDQPS